MKGRIQALFEIIGKFPLGSSFILNSVLFLFVYVFFEARFMTNDDTAMMLISSGKLVYSHPSSSILFSNVLIGYLMKLLYGMKASISWYSFYLVISLFIAHVFLCYLIIKNNPYRIWVYLVYFFSGGVFILLYLQFTIVASFVAMIGLFFFFRHSQESTKRKSTRRKLIAGSFLIILAGLIRFEAVALIAALASPVYIVDLISKRRMTFTMLWLVGTLVIGTTGWMLSNRVYESQNRYYSFNQLRAVLTDFKIFNNIDEKVKIKKLSSVKWSDNDLKMIENWFFMDDKTYSYENLSALVRMSSKNTADRTLKKFVTHLRKMYNQYQFPFIALFLLIAFFLIYPKITVIDMIKIALIWLTFISIMSYVFFLKKSPPMRLIFPCLLFLSVLPYFVSEMQRKFSMNLNRIASIAFLLMVIGIAYIDAKNLIIHRVLSKELREKNMKLIDLANAVQKTPVSLIISWQGMPLEAILPFDKNGANANYENRAKMIPLGCFERTPETTSRLNDFGIKDIYEAIVDNKSVALAINNNSLEAYTEMYKKFMAEHYNRIVVFEVLLVSEDFTIIRFKEDKI